MGFFSSIGSALSSVGSAICRSVSSLCSAITGTSLGGAIGGAISKFVSTIGVSFPPVQIINAIITVASIVSKIAEALGIKEKEKDEPDELAMKAERSERKPEEFDSTEAYIKHLQDEIELTDEDKKELENMDDEKRSAYRATGAYLYTKYINEKLGFDKNGLKHPDLVGITVEILVSLAKLVNVLSPTDLPVYIQHLQTAGLTLNDLDDYLHNTVNDLNAEKKIQNALAGAMTEINPTISEAEIEQMLSELNIEE